MNPQKSGIEAMKNEHSQPGHLNVYRLDHDSPFTGYGKHDRVVAFLPDADGLFVRVDHIWGLGEPSDSQVMEAARKTQGIKGRWSLQTKTRSECGGWTEYMFKDV